MSLVDDIKTIQRAVGAQPDGIFGPRSAAAVLRHLERVEMVETQDGKTQDAREELDERTRRTIATLDPRAIEIFEDFMMRAKATAATLGCDYVAISGTRTWEEQAALYQKYKAGGPKAAPPGYSWHNFGTAIDCGVFRAKSYLDNANPELARRVHAACAEHAMDCGLEWGGTWKGRSCDPPHYQVYLVNSTPTAKDRAKFKQEGSLL